MPSRASPTEKIRGEIDALFGSGRELSEVLEDVARLGARLIMQAEVEAEVEEFLGRARYQRRSEVPDARPGSRNGYCPTTVKTTAGQIILTRAEAARQRREVRLPVVRHRRVQDEHVGDPGDRRVRARAVGARRRGGRADALGPQAALSKSTVSRVCQAIRDEFDAWRARAWTRSSWTTCSWMARTSRCRKNLNTQPAPSHAESNALP